MWNRQHYWHFLHHECWKKEYGAYKCIEVLNCKTTKLDTRRSGMWDLKIRTILNLLVLTLKICPTFIAETIFFPFYWNIHDMSIEYFILTLVTFTSEFEMNRTFECYEFPRYTIVSFFFCWSIICRFCVMNNMFSPLLRDHTECPSI